MKKGTYLETCGYCKKKIHSSPLRIIPATNTIKRFHFAHKECKDERQIIDITIKNRFFD